MLGAMTQYMTGTQPETSKVESWSYADICKQTFRLILPADCYQLDPVTKKYKDISSDELGLKTLYNNAMELKIVGVVRQSDEAVSGMMSGAIGYTNALTKKVVEETQAKDFVAKQLADPTTDIFTGLPFKESNEKLTDDEIKKAVTDYCKDLSSEKKAKIYVSYMSVAPQKYIDSTINEQLKNVSRKDIEKKVVENYPEYKDMLASMDDDTLFAYMREMMSEQISKKYAEEVKKSMSKLSTASLAKASLAYPSFTPS